jgi:hypothetical protein
VPSSHLETPAAPALECFPGISVPTEQPQEVSMSVKKRDLIFVAVVGAIFATFYFISGDIKTARVPQDDNHKQYLAVVQSDGKIAAEKFCGECHMQKGPAPFPKDHKSQDRCLICHKWAGQ